MEPFPFNKLIDREPSKDISLFFEINPGDPVDGTLKDMVAQMTESCQIDEAIKMVKFYRRCFPRESQHCFDTILVDLHKVKKDEDISNSDSLYIKAKRASEKGDLQVASHLYHVAINQGENFDGSVKDLADVLKRLGRTNDGIQMIQKYKKHCSKESQEFFDRELIILDKVKKTEDIFNSIDSLYIKAKRASEQGELKVASYLYYVAISKGDRFESSVKDLADVLRRLGQTEEGIQMIQNYRKYCSNESQETFDRVLLNLYKNSDNRTTEQLELLQKKIKLIDDGITFGKKTTRISRVHRKNKVVWINQERSSLLASMAWVYMKQENYSKAEEFFRKALSMVPNKNNQCDLAICLINSGKIPEAKSLLQAVTPSSQERSLPANCIKAYDKACELLTAFENGDNIHD